MQSIQTQYLFEPKKSVAEYKTRFLNDRLTQTSIERNIEEKIDSPRSDKAFTGPNII